GAPGSVLSSNWSIEAPEKGSTAITFAPGISDVVIRNLSIRHHCFAIRAQPSKEAPRTRIAFENIAIEQVRHGFYLSDCDDLSLTGCTLKRYSKHGFRFEQGCDRVTVKRCIADCSEGDAQWETKTEVFPFGILIGDGDVPNSSLRFEDCVARNNIKSNQTVKYTNGDGFVAEGKNSDVTFIRCRALRNQDGGFDLKVKDVTLTDCIATGHRRDFRIWNGATLENCFAGESQTGLWIKEGTVTAKHMTFLNHRKSSVELDDLAAATVTLTDCLLASAQAGYEASIGKYDASGTIVAKSPEEAGLPQPKQAWNGNGDAMNSTRFPGKGFSSVRREQ
ncbi:MAG TPA: right-handed parallel beta-helix repeat-containing protein, partial [Haloferula sp.]